jgi:hypothetical protein
LLGASRLRKGSGGSVARPPRGRWNPLLLPGAARTALLSLVTQSVRTLLRGNRERLVVVGTCGFERFYGAFRPGKNSAFQHTSILVRPRQDDLRKGLSGGAAGYCPRVRCVYDTLHFIAIAGRSRHSPYRESARQCEVTAPTDGDGAASPGSRSGSIAIHPGEIEQVRSAPRFAATPGGRGGPAQWGPAQPHPNRHPAADVP